MATALSGTGIGVAVKREYGDLVCIMELGRVLSGAAIDGCALAIG